MPDFVRVKDKETKHEYTIVASTYREELHELLEKDAVHVDGTALPAKHHVSLSSKSRSSDSAAASSGQKATPDKENS